MLASVLAGKSYLPLLPFLEHPHALVQERFVSCLIASGIPESAAKQISLQNLVLYALTTHDVGAYWGASAMSWLEDGFPLDSDLALALETASQDKRFPQGVRHQAFSLAKRWRRSRLGVGA